MLRQSSRKDMTSSVTTALRCFLPLKTCYGFVPTSELNQERISLFIIKAGKNKKENIKGFILLHLSLYVILMIPGLTKSFCEQTSTFKLISLSDFTS